MGLTQGVLAEEVSVQRECINELYSDRGNVAEATPLNLVHAFGDSLNFGLSTYFSETDTADVARRHEGQRVLGARCGEPLFQERLRID